MRWKDTKRIDNDWEAHGHTPPDGEWLNWIGKGVEMID
jgi:hypothetical protein